MTGDEPINHVREDMTLDELRYFLFECYMAGLLSPEETHLLEEIC